MQVVHVEDVVAASRIDVLSELLNVDFLRGSLHHDNNDVLDDGDSRHEDNDREEVGAKGVGHPERWEEVDDSGCDNDTDGHEHVAKDVQEGSIDVDVALMLVVVVMVAMAMIVAVVVSVVVVMFSLMALFVLKEVLLHVTVLDLLFGAMVVIMVSMAMSMVVVMMSMTVAVIVGMVVMVMAVIVVVLMLSTQVVVTIARVQDLHLD